MLNILVLVVVTLLGGAQAVPIGLSQKKDTGTAGGNALTQHGQVRPPASCTRPLAPSRRPRPTISPLRPISRPLHRSAPPFSPQRIVPTPARRVREMPLLLVAARFAPPSGTRWYTTTTTRRGTPAGTASGGARLTSSGALPRWRARPSRPSSSTALLAMCRWAPPPPTPTTPQATCPSCGSRHASRLRRRVVRTGAHLPLAPDPLTPNRLAQLASSTISPRIAPTPRPNASPQSTPPIRPSLLAPERRPALASAGTPKFVAHAQLTEWTLCA
jgi:hypothetical protein